MSRSGKSAAVFCFLTGVVFLMATVSGARAEEVDLPNATAEVYKRAGDTELSVYIHTPEDHRADDKRPAVVFFFGGGWTKGTPVQFRHHCEHFASRGMVAIAVDYRVATRHAVKAVECLADAKSAMRWVRSHAARLGIDPQRIVASGGSAGGHLAAATALVPGFDDPADDLSVSAVPNALALFNPVLVVGTGAPGEDPHYRASEERIGASPAEFSPANHISPGAPPTIIFHGYADETVPYASAEVFKKRMVEAGNHCELIGYEGQMHGFFNYGRAGGKPYRETLLEMDRFLVSLDYLPNQDSD